MNYNISRPVCLFTVISFLLLNAGCASKEAASEESADTNERETLLNTIREQAKLQANTREIPQEVWVEIYKRLDTYSSQVDPFERRESEADNITDPAKRLAEYEALTDSFAECRDGVENVIEDPKYKLYRDDPANAPAWQGYLGRLKYWQNKMHSIKKKRDAAFVEVNAGKAKDKK